MHFFELNPFARRTWRCEASGNGGIRRGVLLINLGTPDDPTPSSVGRYLGEFLVDPAVIQLPRGLGFLNGALGRCIAKFRAQHSAALYRSIWTEEGSPLLTITRGQAAALQEVMPPGWRVYFAMRYGNPSIRSVLEGIERDGLEEVTIVPMYPQYSGPTTGTAMRVVYDYLGGDDHPLQVTTRLSWYNDHRYIASQTELLRQYASAHHLTPDDCFLLFSTHGLPVSYVDKGDPYPQHVAETVSLVAQRLGWPKSRWSLAFQSRFGPVRWLQPYTDEALASLCGAGEKRILVCPISFVSDCLETLEEIDVRYRRSVEQTGAELFLCPALNTFQPFILALKHLVLQGCSAMRREGRSVGEVAPARAAEGPPAARTGSLVMVGASIAGRVGSGRGPGLRHVDAEALLRLKRPACEIPALLRDVRCACDLEEAFVWNTCHRFEWYGFVRSHEKRTQEIARAVRARIVANTGCDEAGLNTLVGDQAKHHLLRTACGLNSSLPGERDVLDQLQAGLRLAERAETAGPLIRGLVEETVGFERGLRRETAWGDFAPDYAQIGLQFVADRSKVDLGGCRILVVGGSTTSASVLRTLTGHFGVASKRLTLIYRGHKHGGHLKLLRKAIGEGERIRVQTYEERLVDRAISDAEVIVFGVDRETPVLDRERMRRCRGESGRPLIVVDFNLYGSTRDLAGFEGVEVFGLGEIDRAVSAGAGDICADEDFQRALAEVEARIASVMGDAAARGDGDEGVGRSTSTFSVFASRSARSQT